MNNFNYDPFVMDNGGGGGSSVKLPPLNLYWTNQDPSVQLEEDDVFADLVSSDDIKEEQGDFFTDFNNPQGYYYPSSCSYSVSSDGWTVSSPGSCSSSLTQSPSSASSQYSHEQAFQFPPDAHWLAGQQQQFPTQQQIEDEVDQDEDDEDEVLHCRWIDCKGSFNSQEDLVQHIERSHVDQRRAEDFTCFWASCPRRHRPFNARYKLLIHMRVHSGEKPNRCSVSKLHFNSN